MPPSFTSIRIRLALSVRRVITLINKMEVGMRDLRLPPRRRFSIRAFSAALCTRAYIAREIRVTLSARQVPNVRCSHARLTHAWTFVRLIGPRGFDRIQRSSRFSAVWLRSDLDYSRSVLNDQGYACEIFISTGTEPNVTNILCSHLANNTILYELPNLESRIFEY